MALYGKVEYWNARYTVEKEPYEWYQSYEGIRHLMTAKHLAPQAEFPPKGKCRVLILGCGSSTFGEDMVKDGFTGGISNVDFSNVVIDRMKRRYDDAFYESLPEETALLNRMQFVCADITKLPFEDESFDLVVVKGTLDSILCSASSIMNARRVMAEAHRVLAMDHGAMVLVSYANAQDRMVYYENEGPELWENVNVRTVPGPFVTTDEGPLAKFHYVYTSWKSNAPTSNAFEVEASQGISPTTISDENVSLPSLPKSEKIFNHSSAIDTTPGFKGLSRHSYAARARELV